MRVIWSKRATSQRLQQEKWLADIRGLDFARTFNANIDKAIDQIAQMPDIGQREKTARGGMSVRSVLTHPKCRIVYGYDDKTVVIISLKFLMMRE
jgi:plasmid stabilization system protein ParE